MLLLLVFEGVRSCLQSGHERLHGRLPLPEHDQGLAPAVFRYHSASEPTIPFAAEVGRSSPSEENRVFNTAAASICWSNDSEYSRSTRSSFLGCMCPHPR